MSTTDDEQFATLTTIERKLLSYLARNADRAVGRDELLAEVWGYRGQVVTRTVDVTVRRLRTKLEVDSANPRHIVTEDVYNKHPGVVPEVNDPQRASYLERQALTRSEKDSLRVEELATKTTPTCLSSYLS